MTNFGATFKQARESKGISLEQIASDTRISTRFLRAIENEEFHLLPGGIFNRGFVRAYADRVGLDPDQAVADYERLAEVRPPEVAAAAMEHPPGRKKGGRLYPIAIGALLAVIVVFYVVTRESDHTAQTASTPPAATAPSEPATAPNPAPVPAPEAENTPAPPAPETAPQATAAREPAPAPAPATAAARLTLEVEAEAQTWIKVVADGHVVDPSEVLRSGMTRKFTAQNSIVLSVGNAAGLNLKLNDKPVKPIGKNGQVRQITITPDNLKDFTGT